MGSRIDDLISQFSAAAADPRGQLEKYLRQGKKVIGCSPYYVPEELVFAADMVPFGLWGQTGGQIDLAQKYFAPFYCSLAQLNLELGMRGAYDGLSGIIVPCLCDTLRPFSQNFRVACPHIPFIFLAHPQNRKPEYGITFTISQYAEVKEKLEEISGQEIIPEKIRQGIKVYNESRRARRHFVKLAGEHPEWVSAKNRNAVLKSACFMWKPEHTAYLEELNALLDKESPSEWQGNRIFTSGILLDSPALLEILDRNRLSIVADDVAQESRALRMDVPEKEEDPLRALALQFAAQDHDTILYDPQVKRRPEYIVQKVRESGAEGVIVGMMQFCDPEEMEFPSLAAALEKEKIPYVKIGMDQQTTDFGQARTLLEAFSEILPEHSSLVRG